MKYGIISTMMICVMMKRECSPKRSVLTGEWYIRSVSFEDDILFD